MDGKGKNKVKRKVKKKLTVNAIESLGGEKEDLALIGDIKDDSDASDFEALQEDFDVDPVNKYELRDFIEKLEIYKYKPKDDDEDSEAGSEKETVDTKDKKSKKKKKKGSNKAADPDVDKDEKDKNVDELTDDKPDQPSSSNKGNEQTKAKKEKNKYKSLVQHNEVSSTTKDQSQNYRTHMKKYQPRKYLLVKSSSDYYDQQNEANPEDASNKISNDLMKQMEGFASKLLQDEISIYMKQKEMAKKSNVGWMKTVIASGTLADKIAALTVLVQESPVHSIAHMDTLLAMTKKHVKRESMQAADALKELFLTQLIPDQRKLMLFSQRPLSALYSMTSGNKDNMDKKLMLWYYESQLKERYSLFVKSLQEMSHNPLLAIRTKAVSTINQLLIHKPEEEKTLLTLLLNKIGDPHYKLASTVSYSLLQLVEKHPNMKEVVVREVEHLLFRPNISQGAQYYSICFLNQLKLSHYEKVLAVKLIKIYFAFFRANMKKGEVDSKMMSALLSGVNRAFPYAELDEKFLSGQIDNLYKLVHIVNFGTSVQALSLLYQVMDTSNNVSERYYTALYKKVADPALKSASKPALFLNLLYKSLKADKSDRRRRAFIKRILQVLFYQHSQFICGALILISEILKAYPGLLNLSSQEEESDDEEHFVDAPDPDSDSEGIKTEKEIKVEKTEEKPVPFKFNRGKDNKPKSWIHRRSLDYKSDVGTYDPFHRNPLFCHADKECVWELEKLTRHYHPSVSLFAKTLLQGGHIKYDGNPLQDFTIIRFLDRFVFKNPKKEANVKRRVATLDRVNYVPSGVRAMTVDSEEFLKLPERKIPVDDLFYHRYFTRKALLKKKKTEEEEMSDVSDDEFDEFMDKLEKDYQDDELALGYDFASEFEKKAGKKIVDSSSDEDDEEDDMESVTLGGEEIVEALSDEEVEFDDEEYAEAMEDKMEGLLDDGLDDDIDDDDDNEDGDAINSKMAAFDDDDDDDDDGNDNEIGGMDLDEEDISFSDDEDEFKELLPKGKSVKRKAPPSAKPAKSNKKEKKTMGIEGAYVAAEEFGDLMDENAGSLFDMTGSSAMSTSDKAGAKQLKWEMERDRWLRGESWKEKKRKQFGQKKFGQKRGTRHR